MSELPTLAPARQPVARRLLAFVVTFAAGLVVSPALAIYAGFLFPRVVRLFLFFWPQSALAPYGFTSRDDMTRTYLTGGPNYLIATAFWLVVGLGLAWLLRRKPVRVTALLTLPVSFAISIVGESALDWAGIGIYYDGP